ncbi:MAG: ketoacyl-ACP synthase III [Bacteroidota bacterium]
MSEITAFGTYVPERIVDNAYFESIIDTNDEWISSRTGIKSRRFAKEGEFSSDLAIKAIHQMMENYNVTVKDVDFIVVCTTTPDQIMPNVASRIQYKMGIENAGCNDVYGACAGFVYGLQIAHGFVASGMYKKVLVVGSETLTKATDYSDRTSCILFGDGAGVLLVEPSEEEHFLAFNSGTNGEYGHDLYLSHKKNSVNGVGINPIGKIIQNGRSVFKWAVTNIPIKVNELLNKAGLKLEEIDYLIPHSANLRIIEAIAKSLKLPLEKMPESVVNYGNTSTASIPLAIANAQQKGQIKKGDLVLMIGFGGGLTFSGVIVRW